MDTSKLLKLANARKDNNTVVLTFSDSRYTEVLLNWLIGLDRLGISNYLVVSLDEEIHDFLRERGFPSFLSPLEGDLGHLWALRTEIFRTLCAHDIDFIHSDTDAIWKRNPLPDYFGRSDHQLIASQGTVWPDDVVKTQGFVLCCGLFYVKACAQTHALLDDMASEVALSGDDQIALNRAIQRRQIRWHTRQRHSYTLNYDGQQFLCFKDTITGESLDQQLKLALLPHHLFQRLHMPGQDAYVKHLLSDKLSGEKMKTLEQTDCRFLKKGWEAIRFDARSVNAIDSDDRHDSLKTLCLVLGPYRNLTSLTAAIASLHPNCQVLNHAGATVLSDPRLNFLDGYSAHKFNNFIDYALTRSAGGCRGDAGGSILHSHAYDAQHPLRSLYEERYGENRSKASIDCLFWKESLMISSFIRDKRVAIDELISRNAKLRFLMPIRNPLDCAISNRKTGHANRLPGCDGSKEGILEAILEEIRWFVQMADRQPCNFFYFLQNDFNEETLRRLADFLSLDRDQRWLEAALAAYEIKSVYRHEEAFIRYYRKRVSEMFANAPRLRDRLLAFSGGDVSRTPPACASEGGALTASAPVVLKRRKLRTLVYGLQSSGASLFTYFLSQRPDTVGIIDLNNHRLAPALPLNHDIALKAVITTRWPLERHIDNFGPDRTILFLRNPYNNYYSLRDKAYADKSGTIDEKFRLLDYVFMHRQRFDLTICYEDFIADPENTLERLASIGWHMKPEYYRFPRTPREVADFNNIHSEWCRLNPAAAGPAGGWGMGNIQSSKINLSLAEKPYNAETDKRVKELCPNLHAYYRHDPRMMKRA